MNRRIILGMGAGQCGLSLLPQLLNCLPGTRVTYEELPLLPWARRPGVPGIRERLRRMLTTRSEPNIGDVASFYLPYVEEAIATEPGIRLVCLQRPRDEVVEGFCRDFESQARPQINHWAREPAPGWSHDPFRTFSFPQYDTTDVAEGIRRYWEEYYATASELQRRYPEHMRIWDTNFLMTEEGVRELLTFAGFPAAEQLAAGGRSRPEGPRSDGRDE